MLKQTGNLVFIFFLKTMGSLIKIKVPTTPSIANFIRKTHPNKIIIGYKNHMGLTMYSIITYRNKGSQTKYDESKYEDYINLYLPRWQFRWIVGKVIRPEAAAAINAYITKLIYVELEKNVLIKSHRKYGYEKQTLKSIIEDFQEEYGLCIEEFNYLRLHQHIIRFNRKKKIDTVSNNLHRQTE